MRPALAYYGLLLSIVAFVAVGFDPLYGDGRTASAVLIVLGLVLVGEAALLVFPRGRDGRRALQEHLLARIGRARIWRFVLGPMLLAIGVVFAGFGALELVRGLRGMF